MPHFDLFFKTADLWYRFTPDLDEIPAWFEFSIQVGTPEVTLADPLDPVRAGFPFPRHAGDVYIFDDVIPATAVGLGGGMRASIRVRPEDRVDVLVLRLWHEILHAVGQPADDMHQLRAEWQTPFDRLVWWLWPYLVGYNYDVPYWHRKFYHWLTTRAALGGGN
jgi:hypothetical protein